VALLRRPRLPSTFDPNKVTGFAKTVQTNVQGTITPTAPSVRSTLDMSVGFGEGNPSVALKAMLQKYGECLATMNQQLTNVGQYVEILVTAANQISTNTPRAINWPKHPTTTSTTY